MKYKITISTTTDVNECDGREFYITRYMPLLPSEAGGFLNIRNCDFIIDHTEKGVLNWRINSHHNLVSHHSRVMKYYHIDILTKEEIDYYEEKLNGLQNNRTS